MESLGPVFLAISTVVTGDSLAVCPWYVPRYEHRYTQSVHGTGIGISCSSIATIVNIDGRANLAVLSNRLGSIVSFVSFGMNAIATGAIAWKGW